MTCPPPALPVDAPTNLLDIPSGHEAEELFEDIVSMPGVRIERIISHGHSTPPERPYVQHWDEWVLVLAGTAELLLEGIGTYRLEPGDHRLIRAGIPHRVTHTDAPTIWLAIHIGEA
ncbi:MULTISPECIES: cupin domain-containing protein [Sphingobium]|jgi:cupin 2 domain-containing protein|uniref:cupin domain-containing protein n=1 Tax=Sphingobium TaxID=165695 RepID=UPI001FF95C28|nr:MULTISPECIES: cupin domain-containing protein [Sphingobium]